jgi:Ca2+-transporting ATPase
MIDWRSAPQSASSRMKSAAAAPSTDSKLPWHSVAIERAAAELGVDLAEGLGEGEVERRLRELGRNRLAEKPPRSPLRLFAAQFRSVLILMLAAAALLALAIGHRLDAGVILLVVAVNASLGFVHERSAERAIAALRRMQAVQCRARRQGELRRVPAEELVPGDVVLLDAGDRVPADGRLVAAHRMEIDESMLTGESEPVAKRAALVLPEDTPAEDRANSAFMNTLVTRGRAELLVTATGMRTQLGRLAELLAQTEEGPTPLERQLDRLGKRIAVLAAGAVLVVLGLGLARREEPGNLVLTAISLAVAAIPEGLPAVVTLALALGMHRMAGQRAILKRLAAVETLGCTTLICSDKTGTLTRNRMEVRAIWYRGVRLPLPLQLGADELEPLLLGMTLCNDCSVRAGEQIGDPTEAALHHAAAAVGVRREVHEARLPRIAEVPFDPTARLMATFHADGAWVRVFVKGAPEVVFERCVDVLGPDGVRALDDEAGAAPRREHEAMAGGALRVLAVATRTLERAEFEVSPDPSLHLTKLTFVGLVGLMDAPRPEVRDALEQCRAAGIRVKMVTGDHARTAAAVAGELGLEGEAVTGAELDRMDERELFDRFESIAIFARVSPEHKLRIVRAARARGHVVAMTGDGVNDAPALKSADIGVAMGEGGTEVAKEAAAMVLADDNFATIVRAVREGRAIYDNIGKFVRFQLSTNLGALTTVLAAPLVGLPLPFNPIQILWVNIIMDGPPALALGLDPPAPGIMAQPPRSPSERILPWRRLARLLGLGALMAAGSLCVLAYGLRRGPPEHALTLAFTTFVLFQLFNVFNARRERSTAFDRQLFANWRLWAALTTVAALQWLAVSWGPAQAAFHTAELSAADFGLAAAVASSILVIEEARKLVARLADS